LTESAKVHYFSLEFKIITASIEAGYFMKIRIVLFSFVLILLFSAADAQELVLRNPIATNRLPEVVEVPLAQVLSHLQLSTEQARDLVATNGKAGERIPLQLYSNTVGAQPDVLLLLVELPANGKVDVAFHVDPKAAPQPAQVFGREAPERKDDFAWENEFVTYRIYGPALEATGEITSGIDVWSKRVPNLVIDSFYKRDKEGFSYHEDDGKQGLDSYYVGPTRGCGGTAVFSGNKLIVSKNYTSLHKLGDGPIRFAFEVTYAPWNADGTSVVETKRIVLDAGTYLNKITSTYSFEGPETLNLIAGLAVHEGASATFPVPNEIAAVWDTPQKASAGRIATGMIAEPGQQATTLEAAGHALLEFTRHSGQPFIYYAGSGWSKGSMPTAAAWEDYLKVRLTLLEHPISVSWAAR
jgi:hypothetical protein